MKNVKFIRILPYLLICSVAALAFAGCTTVEQLAQPLPVALPTRFSNTPLSVGSTYIPVERGEVVRTLTFPGVVRAGAQQNLYFAVEGGVAHVYAKSGDTVEAGELIADLEADFAKIDLADAEIEAHLAELELQEVAHEIARAKEAAQLELEARELELERLRTDTRTSSTDLAIAAHQVRIAQAELQQAELRTVALVEKRMEAAQLRLERMQLEVERHELRAPVAGTVRLGQELRVGQWVQAYTPVGRIVDPESLLIESELPTTDLELIYAAMPVKVRVTTLSGYTFPANVVALPQPYGDSNTPFVQIAPDVSEAEIDLREGANVVVYAEVTASDVLVVPNDAIQTVAGRQYVVLYENEALREQEIAVGLRGDTYTQVIDGLSEGMEVVGP